MGYDPFTAGPRKVTVADGTLVDAERAGRVLPWMTWRPSGPGPFPLVVYSHASYGWRAQSSFLCRHLASHGYLVAAVDHTGNTREQADRPRAAPLTTEERDALIRRIIRDRVPDIRFAITRMLATDASVDPEHVALIGWSFGGWAVLATLEHEQRVAAVVALAPAGASDPLPGIIPATLTFAWQRDVPALYLAADHDRFIPLRGVRELYERTPARKRLFVLAGADHGHFADDFESDEPTTAEQAHLFTRALSLAHLDAVLKGSVTAARFLSRDAIAALRARGVVALAA